MGEVPNRRPGTDQPQYGPALPIKLQARTNASGAVIAGQVWQVEMWDRPASGGPPSDVRDLTDFHMNVDFRSDLVFWTNISGVPDPTRDAACRLYSTVQTNTWTIRFNASFDPKTGVMTINVPAQPSANPVDIRLVPDPQPQRAARPVKGSGLEVRSPTGTRLLAIDFRN